MPVDISLDAEELSKSSIFIGMPCYGGQMSGITARSLSHLSSLCDYYGIKLHHHYLFQESLITRARSYVADEFMRSDFTHLMFIDSDIGFNAPDVLALMALSQKEDSPYDIICGPYPKKCISWEKIKTAVDKGYADDDPSQLERFVGDYVFNPKEGKFKLNEPVEVLEAGTGFMMIRRKTFEAFNEAYPYLKYRPDHARSKHFDGSREIMMYFDCEIDRGYSYQELHNLKNNVANAKTDADLKKLRKEAARLVKLEEKASKRYLSEDYFFCRLAQRIGLKVWMCPWISLKHMGSYIYGGSVPDLAMIGASVTVNKDQLKKK